MKAALISTACFAALLAAQDAPPGGIVEGTVINSVTGAAIGGASVVLFASQSSRYETTADATGHFKITGMAPGSYRSTVRKDGFAPPPFDLTSLSSGLNVASAPDPVRVELKLTPLSAITGRVFGPDGKPAVGVEVSLYPNITADVSVTDGQGRFGLEDIRPGSYTLIAKPPKSVKAEEARDGTRTAIVATYYPSVADRSQAQQLMVHGEGNAVYDIRLQTARVRRVRGIVLDEEGKPLPGAELTLSAISEAVPEPMGLWRRAGGPSLFAVGIRPVLRDTPEASAISGKDGRFEFPAVPSGDWRISAESDSIRGDAQIHAVVTSRGNASAPVRRDDVDLQVQVTAAFKVTATIEWKSDVPGSQRTFDPPVPFAPVILVNSDNNELAGGGFVEGGALFFENILPGRYRAIVTQGLSGQIFLGESEVTGQTFPLAAGGPRLGVVLKTWAGTVRGVVEKGDGATVVLLPQRTEGAAIGQTITCGAGGSFEMSEVSPGDYYIAAFDRMDGLSPSAAMISLVPSRGTSVKLEEGSAASVTLSVISIPR